MITIDDVKVNYRSRLRSIPGISRTKLQELNSKLSREIIDLTVQEVKKVTPVEKGNLKRSIKIQRIFATKSGLADARYKGVVGSFLPYARFPEVGARPSRGRYLPRPMVRISRFKHPASKDIGIHPGQKPQLYFTRGFHSMEEKVPGIIDRFYEREYSNAIAQIADKALRRATRRRR